MHSLRHFRRQVDDLQRRIKPVLAILRLRNLAMEFCDEFDEAAAQPHPDTRFALMNMSVKLMPRIRKAGFIIDTHSNLLRYIDNCLDTYTRPEPREFVFLLIPWAKRGPHLRPDLWERPATA